MVDCLKLTLFVGIKFTELDKQTFTVIFNSFRGYTEMCMDFICIVRSSSSVHDPSSELTQIHLNNTPLFIPVSTFFDRLRIAFTFTFSAEVA